MYGSRYYDQALIFDMASGKIIKVGTMEKVDN